jgi:hypothetical protein
VNSDVIALAEGKLYQLPNPYELNGYVATHPPWASGFAPCNAFLLVEGGRALLIDSGYSVHEQALLRRLGTLIDPETPLEVFMTTIGEFSAICNAKPVADHFNVVKFYGIILGANEWMDFRPEHAPYGTAVGGGRMAEAETGLASSSGTLDWSHAGRTLDIFAPPIRLLPSHWAFDAETGTLFTGDSFTHVWRETDAGPWAVHDDEEPPSLDEVYDFLVSTRYWWLPGAATEELERDIADVFGRYDVQTIAPRFGCTLIGRDVVAAHYDLLMGVLRRARESEATGVLAGAEPMGRRS